MASIFKTVAWEVKDLVASVSSGTIQLPDLQRPFVWPKSKVRDLLDSMYRGYPVGELMFWDVEGAGESRSIDKLAQLRAQYQIVDGQQRLTSLFAVVKGRKVRDEDYRDKEIKISFNPFDERFEVWTPVIAKSVFWLEDISEYFQEPLKVARRFKRRLSEAEGELSEDTEDQIEEVFQRLSAILSYQFEVVHIQSFVEKRTVADIFVRINSEGVNLKAYDYILTWFSVFWPEGRERLEAFARNGRVSVERANEINDEPITWTGKNHFIDVEAGQLVRVLVALGQNRAKLADAYSALQAKDRKTGAVDPERQEKELSLLQAALDDVIRPRHWDEFIMCLPMAGFRSRKGITSDTNLISSYVIWLLAKLRFSVDNHDLRVLIGRWFFMSQLTSRYTGSGETQLQKDLDRFSAVHSGDAGEFKRVVEDILASVLTSDFWTFRMPESLVTSNGALSPAYQSYLAALNVLGAEMFMLNMPVQAWMDPTRQPVRGLEGHHLFPRAYQREHLGIEDLKLVNQAANFAPTDWHTNAVISDRAPHDYWPDLVRERGSNPAWLEKQLYWHALPEDWFRLGYEDFLLQRRKLMSQVTKDAYERLSAGHGAEIVDSNGGFLDEGLEFWSLDEFILRGLLVPGDSLVPVEDTIPAEAIVTEDGTLRVNGLREFDTLDDATRWLDVTNVRGLEFWAKSSQDGTVALVDLARGAGAN
jgi:hypothetical protein